MFTSIQADTATMYAPPLLSSYPPHVLLRHAISLSPKSPPQTKQESPPDYQNAARGSASQKEQGRIRQQACKMRKSKNSFEGLKRAIAKLQWTKSQESIVMDGQWRRPSKRRTQGYSLPEGIAKYTRHAYHVWRLQTSFATCGPRNQLTKIQSMENRHCGIKQGEGATDTKGPFSHHHEKCSRKAVLRQTLEGLLELLDWKHTRS